MELTAETITEIEQHVARAYPSEACGLVIVERGRQRFVACRNTARDPVVGFRLNADEWAAAEDRGEVVAVVHSHPDAPAVASEHDRVVCESSGVPWFIVSVRARDVAFEVGPEPTGEFGLSEWARIDPVGYRAPLVGRSYSWGVLDCWTLIRDWYQRERGITLPDVPGRDDPCWWEVGTDLMGDHYRAFGFRRMADDVDLEPGDVLLFQMRAPVPNHAGVYIGDGLVLHHMAGRLSSRDVWGGYLAETCTHRLRYEGAA